MKALTSSLSLVAICAITAPAVADVTAAELWAEWQANAAEAGLPVTAQVSATGDGMTISGMTWTFPEGPEAPEISLVFDDIVMSNEAGGVTVSMASPFNISFTGSEDGQVFGANFELALEAMDFAISGDMSDLTYDFAANSVALSLVELVGIPGDQPTVDMNLTVGQTAALITYTEQGDDVVSSSRITSGPAAMALNIVGPPSEPGRVTANFSMGASQSVTSGTNMTLFQGMMMGSNPNAPLDAANLPTQSSEGSYASLSYDMNIDVPDTQFSLVGSNNGGRLVSDLSADGLSFDISSSGTSIALRSNEIPVPIDLSAAATRAAFTMPVVAQPEPSRFAVLMNYQDVAVSELLWSMVDPSQAIPRTPITLQVDIEGLAQMFTDLISMDPATLTGPPGELRSVTLNNLIVSAAGAQLTGSGAAEFTPGAFPPVPVGSVDLGLSGLNGLLDALTAAGLLPIEQAGMARAMVGMFARPGAGADTLESTIEFLPGGGITANGIPLQ